MSWLPITAAWIIVSLCTLAVLHQYGDAKKTSFTVTLVVFIGWFFPFSIAVLIPMDVSSTYYRRCLSKYPVPPGLQNFNNFNGTTGIPCAITEPYSYLDPLFYTVVYNLMYWTSFFLTWFLLPFMSSFVDTGEFTFWGKMKESLKFNFLYYSGLAVVGIVFLLYVAWQRSLSWEGLRSFVVALSYAWGLFLVAIFMAHGLVEIPRRLWNSGDDARSLKRQYYRAVHAHDNLSDAVVKLNSVCHEVEVTAQRIQMDDPLNSLLLIIQQNCPESWDSAAADQMAPVPEVVTKKYLVSLHNRVKRATRQRDRCECQWRLLTQKAFLLQDIAANRNNPSRTFRSISASSTWTLRIFSSYKPIIDWYWFMMIRPVVMRTLGVLTALMTLTIIWSEVTFFVESPVLSIMAIVMHLDNLSYGITELFAMCGVTYMCICAYSSLLQLKVFNFYQLVPDHHTDEASLLFAAAYLCRLMFPLCYNFLTLIMEQNDTQFSTIMGNMNLVPLLGDAVNYYLPFLVSVLTVSTLLNVHKRILRFFDVTRFTYEDDEVQDLEIEDGKMLVAQARNEFTSNSILFSAGQTSSLGGHSNSQYRYNAVGSDDGMPASAPREASRHNYPTLLNTSSPSSGSQSGARANRQQSTWQADKPNSPPTQGRTFTASSIYRNLGQK